MASIFSKIIKGELPCYKLHEDEYTISFLALHPIHLGHSLVVPKVEIDHFFDTPEPYYSQVFANARGLAQSIRRATGCARVGSIIQGFEVPHFHLHLVPMFDSSDLSFSKARQRTDVDMQQIQQKILQHLK